MYTIKAASVYNSTMLIPGKFKFVITVQDIGRVWWGMHKSGPSRDFWYQPECRDCPYNYVSIQTPARSIQLSSHVLSLSHFRSLYLLRFFVSISIYCIFGCACNFTRGHKGQDLIPHSAFWIDLPVLIAVSCL